MPHLLTAIVKPTRSSPERRPSWSQPVSTQRTLQLVKSNVLQLVDSDAAVCGNDMTRYYPQLSRNEVYREMGDVVGFARAK
jgi:hypothetical protein